LKQDMYINVLLYLCGDLDFRVIQKAINDLYTVKNIVGLT